jgi:hypothetical protein
MRGLAKNPPPVFQPNPADKAAFSGMKSRSCSVHPGFAILHKPENPPAVETKMNCMVLKPVLAFGAALVLLGGCASYDGYDRGYSGGGGAYYGGGYYQPDYYSGSYGYNRGHAPYGGYGGGYYRHDNRDGGHHDGDRGDNRGDHRDHNRSDNGGQRDFSRNQSQQNSAPAQQSPSGGQHGSGRQDSGRSDSGRQDSGSQSRSGGPEGRFGHPGTTANPL